MRKRLDIDLLDPEDPFEIDEKNRPHLYKHLPDVDGRYVSVGEEDLLDLYVLGDPLFRPAKPEGEADWIMVGEVPGIVLAVPLASPKSGDPRKCRPIGLYAASRDEILAYRGGG